jgi:hypothetical protein
MDAPERAIGFGGCRGLAAGGVYDTLTNPELPPVFEVLIQNAGGTITTLQLKHPDALGNPVNYVISHLAELPSNGLIAVNAPIIAPDGNPFVLIETDGANLLMYTMKDPVVPFHVAT